MEIILAQHCKSLTGTLSRKHGYAIKRNGTRFFGIKNRITSAPPEGHLNFILDCAQLTCGNFIANDILVSAKELREAVLQAGKTCGPELAKLPKGKILHAKDIVYYQNQYNL